MQNEGVSMVKNSNKQNSITFIATRFYPTDDGVGNSTIAFCKSLAEKGYKIDVITAKREIRQASFEKYENINIYRLFRGKMKFGGLGLWNIIRLVIWDFWRILYKLKQLNPDLICGIFLWYGVLSAIGGKLLDKISITYAHGSDIDEVYGMFKKLITWFSIKYNDIVITTNEEFKNKINKRIKDKKIYILPNIVEELKPSMSREGYREKLKLYDNKFHLVAVGRLVKVKGIETKGISYIIKAMKSLDNCILHIFGEGPLRKDYEEYIRKNAIQYKVKFYGNVSRETLFEFMKAADVLVFPSLTEGLSMTFIGALALKLPVIVTKVGGARDYIVDGENGLFVERKSAESIMDAVKKLQSDEILRKKLSENGYKTYINNFTSESVVKKFEEILNTSLNNKGVILRGHCY